MQEEREVEILAASCIVHHGSERGKVCTRLLDHAGIQTFREREHEKQRKRGEEKHNPNNTHQFNYLKHHRAAYESI